MSREILNRTFKQKIKIFCKLYKPSIYLILFWIVIFFIWLLLNFEIKKIILIHKKDILLSFSSTFKNMALFFISVVIGSYSIVQALLDDESLLQLAKSQNKKPSKFTEINIYFYSYTLILLFTVLVNGIFEKLLENKMLLTFLKTVDTDLLTSLFPEVLYIYIIYVSLISFEFLIFIRNLYDMFKATAYIRTTKKLTLQEKISIINEFLFNKNEINYLGNNLNKDSYQKMKQLIGKDFTLDEAIIFIKNQK